MRQILLFFFSFYVFLISVAYEAIAQWTVVRQGIGKVDSDYRYRQISFPDAQNGWAVGNTNEQIIYTQNGGISWLNMRFHVKFQWGHSESGPRSVYFLNPKEGWIGSVDKIAHTTDGGMTWEILKVEHDWPFSAEILVEGIHFVSSKEGWINCSIIEIRPGRSSVPLILHTTNGGKTFKPQFVPVPGVINWGGEIQFINAKEGWAEMWYAPLVKEALILQTQDGGKHWEPLPGTGYFDGGFYFLNSLEGWATASYTQRGYYVFHTEDGGKSWVGQSIPPEAMQKLGKFVPLRTLTFANSHFGWAVGYNGVIVRTQDGGKTWELEESGVDLYLEDVQYVPGAVFVLAEDGTVLKRTLEGVISVSSQGKLPSTWAQIKSLP